MSDFVDGLFSLVCGQNPEHTWAVGGVLLPCCQRCTGLYAGACVAAWLHWWLRPVLSARFLQVHGLFLLLMVPFGYHWLPQGPVLRTDTGVLFGFGLVTYLSLPIIEASQDFRRKRGTESPDGRSAMAYAFGAITTLVCLPFLALQGGEFARAIISTVAVGGLCALAALVFANVIHGCSGVLRYLQRRPPVLRR